MKIPARAVFVSIIGTLGVASNPVQTPAARAMPTSFDDVSIKPDRTGSEARRAGSSPGGLFTARNVSLAAIDFAGVWRGGMFPELCCNAGIGLDDCCKFKFGGVENDAVGIGSMNAISEISRAGRDDEERQVNAAYARVQKSSNTLGGWGESIMRCVKRMPITSFEGST